MNTVRIGKTSYRVDSTYPFMLGPRGGVVTLTGFTGWCGHVRNVKSDRRTDVEWLEWYLRSGQGPY